MSREFSGKAAFVHFRKEKNTLRNRLVQSVKKLSLSFYVWLRLSIVSAGHCVIVEWSATQRNLWKAICLLAFVWSHSGRPRRKGRLFRAFVCPHISGQSSCFHSAGLLHRGHFSRLLDVYVGGVMETSVQVWSAEDFDSGSLRFKVFNCFFNVCSSSWAASITKLQWRKFCWFALWTL